MYLKLCKVKGAQAVRINISKTVEEITVNDYPADKEPKVISENLTDIYALSDLVDKYKISIIQIVSNLCSKDSTDLKFLEVINNKSAIKEINIQTDVVSFEPIYAYNNLEVLSVYNSLKPSLILNISNFAKLSSLVLNGNISVHGLLNSQLKSLLVNYSTNGMRFEKCESLEKFTLIRSKGIALKEVSCFFPNLKKLVLTQISLTSLSGIENLKDLEELEVNYCSKLQDISGIVSCHKLLNVYFENVKKLTDITPLIALKHLKDLTFFKCGDIQSLSFLDKIPSLENFLFTGTNIVDGDLTPCLRLKSAWSSTGKRHYNIKVEDLPNNNS